MSEETPMIYTDEVLDIVKSYGYYSYSVGKILNIDPNMVLGAVLEEFNDRHESIFDEVTQYLGDQYGDYLNRNHSELIEDYEEIASKTSAWRANAGFFDKVKNPILVDVGDANIQIYTAIRLLKEYNTKYYDNDPMSFTVDNYDPLDIKKYNDDYAKLAADLQNRSLDTAVKFAGLMVAEGLEWGAEYVNNWNDLSEGEQKGFAVYYYNIGRDAAFQKRNEEIAFAESIGAPGEYNVDIENTDIAQEYLLNEKTINDKIREKINEQKEIDQKCFAAGTQIDMADGSTKSIETIEVGDEVMAYDPEADAGRGGLMPARVTRTMVNQVPHLLDFHGVRVTPGHATLCGDGPKEGKHLPLMDILLADGAVVDRDGELIRAATNLPVGSAGDKFVEVFYITSKSQKTYFKGRMRVGTIVLKEDGSSWRVMDALKREGYRLLPNGLIAKEGEEPHPLYWFGELPKPADYVLKKSGLTLAELYSAEGRELEQPTPSSSSRIGANLGAVYAGMSVN